jgi:hypothetical protein
MTEQMNALPTLISKRYEDFIFQDVGRSFIDRARVNGGYNHFIFICIFERRSLLSMGKHELLL